MNFKVRKIFLLGLERVEVLPLNYCPEYEEYCPRYEKHCP